MAIYLFLTQLSEHRGPSGEKDFGEAPPPTPRPSEQRWVRT